MPILAALAVGYIAAKFTDNELPIITGAVVVGVGVYAYVKLRGG